MDSPIAITQHGDVAVVTINNPPVNALSPAVIDGLARAFSQIAGDSAIRSVVLIGAGKNFVAGADIKEFAKIVSGQSRGSELPALLDNVEDLAKPIVIAIQGTAFGGGLELAMAGHYRLATRTAQVGQPEVKLGLIPGAGGTQRLPRLAGIAKALEMCAQGNPIRAEEALTVGIIDRVVEDDLLTEAIAFAREIASAPIPRTRERNSKLGTVEQNAALFAAGRETARKKQRNMLAPLVAIDSVENALRLNFREGCAAERKLFLERLRSEQSQALIHVFFAEREVAKIPDVPKETTPIPIQRAAVVGAGTMGGGIAMVLANAGIPVLLKEADQATLDRGMANIQKNYANLVKRGRFTSAFVEERLKLITPTVSYEGFSDADLVIEAVFEGMALKKQVFADLDRECKPGAILASNTSTLNIDEIAQSTARPESVVGTHFFSPANVMRLLEIVRGKQTSKEVLATCMNLAKKLGKVGVLVGNCRGFVGNRMFHPYIREATFLVEEGAAPEALDRALYDFGMAMGPLATGDLAGLDVGWRIRKEYRHLEKPGIRQAFAADRLCELGRYGQKTRQGWYRYDENRQASADPEVAQLVRQWSREAGIAQREISASEIVDRCVYALVNEGARILQEGYALRSGDIDIIYLNGYGFPAYRGGPMWYADSVGLRTVYDRICEFQQQHGELWTPAPLLKELALEGRRFSDYSREHGASAA